MSAKLFCLSANTQKPLVPLQVKLTSQKVKGEQSFWLTELNQPQRNADTKWPEMKSVKQFCIHKQQIENGQEQQNIHRRMIVVQISSVQFGRLRGGSSVGGKQ